MFISVRNSSKNLVCWGILMAFAFVGLRSIDVFAATSSSSSGTATITVHVLEAESEAPSQNEPTSDPDPEEYNEPDLDNDDPAEVETEPDDDSMGMDDDSGQDTLDSPDSGMEDESSADSIPVPNTGGNIITDVFSGGSSHSAGLIIGAAALLIGVIVLIIKKRESIKKFSLNNLYECLIFSRKRYHRMQFNSKNREFKLFSWQKITGVAILGGALVFVGISMSKNNQPEEAAAAGFVYPYTVSTDNGKSYDVYVKQGEFARGSFKVTTSTNNLTGYTINMATASQNLANTGNNNVNISMVNDNTAAENFANNTWGFSTDGTNYGKLPQGHNNGRMVHQTKGASTNGNSIVVYFAAKIGADTPVGNYATTIYLDAVTNPVYKNLTFANGNTAEVIKVSNNSKITTNSKVLLGEELKIHVPTDDSGIEQTATINDATTNNDKTITVDKDIKVGTIDDSIHFLKNDYNNEGQAIGDAILIRSQGKYWLVDTGRRWNEEGEKIGEPNANTLSSYLNKLGIKSLDYVLLTHAHGDHMGGVNYLVSKGFINDKTTVYMRGCEVAANIGDDGKTVDNSLKDSCNKKLDILKTKAHANVIDFYNHETERANIQANGINFGNFKMTMFNIDKNSSTGRIDRNKYRENLNSIGMKVLHKPSKKTAFLAADWEWGVEKKYSSAIGKVDILKAGHHGLRTSNSYGFIKTLNPKTVVVTSKNIALESGAPNRQPAAWAYVEQNNGSVYFTGDSTGKAVTASFSNSNYSVKKGTKHSTLADANTSSNKRKAGNYYMKWGGGLTKWAYPANQDGSGKKDDYTKYTAKFYIYVYKSKSSAGNIISFIDRCIDNYNYGFKTSYNDGVSKGRTKVSTCPK